MEETSLSEKINENEILKPFVHVKDLREAVRRLVERFSDFHNREEIKVILYKEFGEKLV